MCLGRIEEDVVLVLQLDEAEGRLVGVGPAGVGVLVLEQVDDHFDHQVLHVLGEVHEGVSVAFEGLVDFVVGKQALAVAGDDVVAVGMRPAEVDAVFLQFGGEVIEPIDSLRVHARGVVGIADAALVGGIRELVHTHGVDAVFGEAGGGEVCRLMVRRAGGIGKVDAPELDRRPILEGEAVLDDANAAVLAGGTVEPAAHVDDARTTSLAG